MEKKSLNHSFTTIPQINLQADETNANKTISKHVTPYLSQLEMDCSISQISPDLNSDVIVEISKYDGKPRSSSMISDQNVRTEIDIVTRNRAGSMFVPNLCVHCKMLEELEDKYQYLETPLISRNVDPKNDSFTNTNSGSLVSSGSSSPSNSSPRSSIENDGNKYNFTKEFGQFLEVPNWKPRASSLDSGIFQNDLVISQSRRASFEEVYNQEKPRATSVDVHMQSELVKSPEEESSPVTKQKKSKARFSIISVSSRQTISRVIKKLKSSKFHLSPSKSNDNKRKYCSQWDYNSHSKEHIWYPDNSVRQRCSVSECTQYNTSETFKCSACKTVSCMSCKYKIKNTCRKTFCRELYNEDVIEENQQLSHHWIHKTNQKGTCKSCSKNMNSQTIFLNKQSVVALQCSWCKIFYHNKKACFSVLLLTEPCHFGNNKESIVHPVMIEKSSKPIYLSDSEHGESDSEAEDYPFVSYSINSSENKYVPFSISYKPILALINPKSGGRQGLDILNELQWILNPRQVFDISSFSPNHILKLYKSIENLRILVGGGDGTVNWILKSVESCFCCTSYPPIAVIPLGTGNDLARELNWGSSYNSNDSVSNVISDMENGATVYIDIWQISTRSLHCEGLSTQATSQPLHASKLPLDSFNNYFSVGSDAATALEFHLDREKNPSRYNSRFKNKLCYAEIGGKDLWKREYKNLADNISLLCDGLSYDAVLSDIRPHCILFLNINNYSAGTNPWGKYSPNSDFIAQSINDGILEVIGLSAASLATLHIGGQGDRICQCKLAEMRILRETPIQIDGEPILIQPCTINISLKNQYPFIKKESRK